MVDEFEIDEGVLENIKDFAVKKAKQFSPKVKGDLKRSIKGRVEGNTIILGSNVEYAGFVEKGTERMVNAHGKHNPKRPVINWDAKTKRGDAGTVQQMPYMGSALYVTAKNIHKFIPKEVSIDIEIEIR